MTRAGIHGSPAAPVEIASAGARAPLAAGLLGAALVARAVSMGTGHLDELWWLCHVATGAMVLGLAAGAPRIVAGAWLYHLVWGAPVWLLDAVATGQALPSSIAAHVGPLVIGGWYLVRRPWPGPVALPAWMVGMTAMIVSRPLTVPAHNVNAAYEVWSPLAGVFPSVAVQWLVSSLVCLALMATVDALLVRWRGGRR
jgi:hypothetical protein